MNKRIYELAEQAGAYCESLRGGDYKPPVLDLMNLEKFAELLIQECADFAYSQSIYSRGVPWNQVIKQHFDIEITDADRAPYFRTIP